LSHEADHCEDGERLERIERSQAAGAEHIRNLATVAENLQRVIGHDVIREAMGVKLRERVGLVGAISELRESQNETIRKVDKIQRGQERLELRLERSEDESENTAIQSRQEIVERARRAEQRAEEEREARLKETKADTARWFRLVVILLSGGSILAAVLNKVLQ
jgi:hypothetical protein